MAGNISDQTTCLSNLSLAGNLSASTLSIVNATISATTIVASNISQTGSVSNSFGTIVASLVSTTGAGTSSFGTATVATSLAIGGGTAVKKISTFVVPFVATTVVATKSTTTNATVSGLSTVDNIFICPPSGSGLSNGVVVQGWCSAADTLVISFSNVSTANAAQITGSLLVLSVRT